MGIRSLAKRHSLPSLNLVLTNTAFNTGAAITLSAAPSRSNIQLAAVSTDSVSVPFSAAQTGWLWRMLGSNWDATNTQSISVWMGTPDPNSSSSGTTITWAASSALSFPGIVVGEFEGRLDDSVIYSAATSGGANSTSVSPSIPNPPIGYAGIALAAVAFMSGGAGIDGGSDPVMIDVGVAGLGAFRYSKIPPVAGTTTFSSPRSSRWSTIVLLVR